MGKRPIRDTYSLPFLPDLAEDFAANTFLASALPGHHSLGSGENRDTHPGKNPGDLIMTGVNTAAGTADTFDTGDDRLPGTAFTRVLNFDLQRSLRGFLAFVHGEVFDKSFFLQNTGNFLFDI